MKRLICTEVSPEEVRNRAMWIATLNDGTVVYQQDNHADYEFENSWLGLKKYCNNNKLSVINVKLRFRDNIITILSDSNLTFGGFYLTRGVVREISADSIERYFITIARYVDKVEDDQSLLGCSYSIPELQWFLTFDIPYNEETMRSVIKHAK